MGSYHDKRLSQKGQTQRITLSIRLYQEEYDRIRDTVDRLNNRPDLPGGITVTSALRHCMIQWLDKWDKPKPERENLYRDYTGIEETE